MIGTTISHYTILEKLGEGGMGVVYKAEDTKLKRTVALKFLPAHSIGSEEEKARFLREAQAAAAINHPNVCTVYEVDEHHGRMFLAMAYLQGQDLADKLAGGPLGLKQAVGIAIHIARGLRAAHDQGTVHRDVKPANVMLTDEGQAVIMDFGLAHLPGAARLTRRDSTLGTTAYMSPEQASGAEIDHRSDLWSAGVVYYEMVSGKMPFWGEYEQAIMYSIFNEDPEPLSSPKTDIPDDFQRIMEKILEKKAERRYQTAAELLTDLTSLKQIIEASESASAARTTAQAVTSSLESSGSRLRAAPSVAVLPFVNMSRNEENEYFTDGVTEDIISALTKLGSIRVAARNSAFQFKGQTPDIREVGRKLKVATVLSGSVRWAGKRLRVTVQLSGASDGFEIWSERYDRVMEDVFEIQDEISRAVVDKLKVELTAGAEEPIVSRSTESMEAYGLYLKGRHELRKLTHEGFRKSIEYYEQAVEADPNYVQPYVGLGINYGYLAVHGWVPPKQVMPKAVGYANKAIQLDESSAEAHTLLAMYQHWYEWDFKGAEESYQRALQLNPGEVECLTMYALLMAVTERRKEAVRFAKRALQWDPLSLDANRFLAYIYYLTRRYDEALEQSRRLREKEPNYFPATWTIGMVAAHKGDYDTAISAWQRARDLAGGDPISEAGLGWSLGLAGRTDEALSVLADFKKRQGEQYFSNYFIAWVYLGLKDWDSTFEWLEKAYEEREGLVIQIAAESLWDPLREDPRFRNLLNRVGLPGSTGAGASG